MAVNKTRFKSHQVNLDPEPWVNERGERASVAEWAARAVGFGEHSALSEWARDPRPEFEPTRDPVPWITEPETGRRWAPRREQFDTPVNRVLVLFRRDAEHNGIKSALEYDWPTNSVASSPDEIEHAHKVLDRLAGWS